MLKGKTTAKEFDEHCKFVMEATAPLLNEKPAVKAKRIERLKKSYNDFALYYFGHYCEDETGKLVECADFQKEFGKALLEDDSFFGVLEWPREHAKSVHACIIAPVWLWVHGKLNGMLLAGVNDDAAKALIADVQAEFEVNGKLRSDFGDQKTLGSWERGDFQLKDGTFFIGIGRGKSPRGTRKRQKRPNYGVIDDIDDDEIVLNQKRIRKMVRWILGAFYAALSIKRSRFVMSGNRIHKQSGLAHIVGDITPDTPKRKGIYHSKVCAIDKHGKPAWWQRFTLEELKKRFGRMGTLLARREYFHEPTIIGSVFKETWMNWGKVPPLHEMDALCMYCDPSFKGNATSDFKAIPLWGIKGKLYYKIKVFCRQCTVTAMVKWWYDFHEQVPDNVVIPYWIEAVFAQDQLLEDFEEEGELRGYQLQLNGDMRDKPDKFMRIVTNMQPLYERGLVVLNIDERGNPDFQESVNQTLALEEGTTTPDDGPDADESAVFILNRISRIRKTNPVIGQREARHNW